MENNACDTNRLDANLLLPPRKRLLAGLKRQNSDVNLQTPSTSCCFERELDTRMSNLLKPHLGNPDEEIVETARLAAVEACKVAQAARVVAEEKAAKAAKAVAAAKNVLELLETLNEETAGQGKYLKKNKMKKNAQVEFFHSKQKDNKYCRTDEELARKLHQVINSSPRISKNSSTSDLKHPKHKKIKISSSKKIVVHNGVATLAGHQTFPRNEIADYVDADYCVQEKYLARVDMNNPKFKKSNGLKLGDGEASKVFNSNLLITANGEEDTNLLEEQVGYNDDSGISRKRWRSITEDVAPELVRR